MSEFNEYDSSQITKKLRAAIKRRAEVVRELVFEVGRESELLRFSQQSSDFVRLKGSKKSGYKLLNFGFY